MSEKKEELFWLHVPLTATRGNLLGTERSRVVVLGRPAQLCTREPFAQSHGLVSAAAVHQWLLFEPMTKSEAGILFEDLRARLPALSVRMRASFRIGPYTHLHPSFGETHNGMMPTLIPADQKPHAVWMEGSTISQQVGWEDWLDTCPPVTDERLLAALSLYVSASDESVPRSRFLTYLTIIDSLAVRGRREDAVIKWIDEKLKEPIALTDLALSSSLQNLKGLSHGTAVRSLVKRAAEAQRLPPTEVDSWVARARDLYGIRSSLSHAGKSPTLDAAAAGDLVALVLEQAINDPSILDAATFTPDATEASA